MLTFFFYKQGLSLLLDLYFLCIVAFKTLTTRRVFFSGFVYEGRWELLFDLLLLGGIPRRKSRIL